MKYTKKDFKESLKLVEAGIKAEGNDKFACPVSANFLKILLNNAIDEKPQKLIELLKEEIINLFDCGTIGQYQAKDLNAILVKAGYEPVREK